LLPERVAAQVRDVGGSYGATRKYSPQFSWVVHGFVGPAPYRFEIADDCVGAIVFQLSVACVEAVVSRKLRSAPR
jgi:hypothetical protein